MAKKIAILGAGIGGLTAAYELKKRFGAQTEITLFEKSARAGGWIRTETAGGFLFECGPRALRGNDSVETLALIHELGLSDQLVTADPAARKRFLYHKGRLLAFPANLTEALASPLTRCALFSLFKDLWQGRSDQSDESVHAFFSRRFSETVAERLIDPLVKGIYAGDPKTLSMQGAFPKLWEREQRSRSLILSFLKDAVRNKKGPRAELLSLKGGLEVLPRALQGKLGSELKLRCPVKKIALHAKHAEVESETGVEKFDYVISTLPAFALAHLMEEGDLRELLKAIPFSSLAVVHLGFKQEINPLRGFGYLVPAIEKQDVLGVIFDSACFPDQNQRVNETRLTVMMGGALRQELMLRPSNELIEIAKSNVFKHLKIDCAPDYAAVAYAWKAIPHYPLGYNRLLQRINQAKSAYPHFFLLGTSFNGVSVNQQVAQAKQLISTFSL